MRPILTVVLLVGAAIALAWSAGMFRGVLGQKEDGTRDHLPIVVSSQRLDFGLVPVNKSVVRQLVLRNEGTSAVQASLSAEDTIYSVTPDRLTLEPGASTRVSVAANPLQPGDFHHELRIDFDTEDADPLIVALQGRVENALQVENELPAERSAGAGEPADRPSPEISLQMPAARPDRSVAGGVDRRMASLKGGADVQPRQISTGMLVAVAGDALQEDSSSSSPIDDDETGEAESGGVEGQTTATGPARGGEETSLDRGVRRVPMAVNLLPVTPGSPAPAGAFDDPAALTPAEAIPVEITDEEAAAAESLPSQIHGDGDPDEVPEDLEEEKDPWETDSTASPTLMVSELSSLMVLGTGVRFSTQQVGILGTDLGGPISLQGFMEFPLVPLAFGESMLFSQSDMAAGWFDPVTGEVSLQIPVLAIDSDGNAAPMIISLTTGTALARNNVGVVVALTGNPRLAGSGLLKMVGVGRIPVGFRNGAEDHLVMVEVVGTLNFGVSISQIPAAQEGGVAG